MQIKFGEKIKQLRRRDGRTQDDLATALGVTCQAVSRWEANGGYPDMEVVPAIANYFHVTIDELFGYHGDREERIREILDQAGKLLSHQGRTYEKGLPAEDISACVDMLRAASEEFPNEPQILIKLAEALHMLGWFKYGAKGYTKDDSDCIYDDVEYNAKNIYWQEALRVYEKLLKSDPSPEDRQTAVCIMTKLYTRVGEFEKARALAEMQNPLVMCREVLLVSATTGEERAKYQGLAIIALLMELAWAVSNAVATNPSLFRSEYGREVLSSVAGLCETIFSDGRCGFWHWNIGYLYETLAGYEAKYGGDIQQAAAYFDRFFEHCQAYSHIYNEEKYTYSAPLLSKVTSQVRGKSLPISKDFWKNTMQRLPQNLCDELRKNEKYAVCFA